jgi:hypothetical protein
MSNQTNVEVYPNVSFIEGGEAQTGHLARNTELAPMPRTMMSPTFLPKLNPKKLDLATL